jgi:5-methylcytosine-specific restriction protein A
VHEVFARNPDVVAEVLERAGGRCEYCGCPAPFTKRSNGMPYLEVHHKIQLAHDGEDTVSNAVALCPNCHRKAHYG